MELRDNWNKINISVNIKNQNFTIGIKSNDNQERDYLVMQIFKKTITKENKRYQVSWPWRTHNHYLCENYKLSLGRLVKLV